jgi:hypothetical protein
VPSLKNAIYSSLFGFAVTIGLSVFADIAYIYTVCGLAGWAAIGHLITLDDDMPGEWSNPEREIALWRSSLVVLVAKFVIFITLLSMAISAPTLARYGA